MLSLRSVTKRYGNLVALDGVSLEIAQGEFFGLLGPNGAGKSTLMSLAAGLRTPEAGEITLEGVPISKSTPAAKLRLGLVPQSIALYTDLTAEQNLRIFGELCGLRGSLLKSRIEEALESAQLADRRHSAVKTFSGGMQRRLNIVASLLHKPKLLLCDEPTVGIDPQSRNAIFDYLAKLNRDGLTVIYSTHYMEEAERLCSRIGIIDHGKILALGPLDELLTKLPFEDEIVFPDNSATAKFATFVNQNGQLDTAGGRHRFRPTPGYPLSAFFSKAETCGIANRVFEITRPSLEAVFLHLTGRKLRD